MANPTATIRCGGLTTPSGTDLSLDTGAASDDVLVKVGGSTKVTVTSSRTTVAGNLTVSGTGAHAIGGSVVGRYRVYLTGNFTSDGSLTFATLLNVDGTLTGATGDTALLTGARFNGSVTTQGQTETITDVAQLTVNEPKVTVGTGDTAEHASTVFITGAPTEGTNNWALRLKSGDAQLGGVAALKVQGSDPSTLADHAHIYAKDVSTSAEVFVQDEAGNATSVSPHDPETGEWRFYSKNVKTGRVVEVDMEAFFRRHEAEHGWGVFHEYTEEMEA